MLNKFKIGHYTDTTLGTGATVIIAEDGAVGGCSVRGASPATRETDLLKDGKMIREIHSVVLSGGSAFGLEAACGVMEYLREKNIGYNAGKYIVPIVVGASLYDLEYKSFSYPTKQNGYDAAKNAVVDNWATGEIGAATGATASKIMGVQAAVKTSIGIQTATINNLEVAVILACNPLGDIVKDGLIVAGAKGEDGKYLDATKVFTMGGVSYSYTNTTIGAIITNAKLTKEQCNLLADIAHDGFARAISPSHTTFDGDCMFCMASGEKDASFNSLLALVPDLTAKAIQSTVEGVSVAVENRINGLAYKLLKKILK